ncbi:MAG: magnesium-translocating P-type ATPase, partial [Oscillospiraceae bacterium]
AVYSALFQTGWFVESMWTQTLVIHMIRTQKIPFLQSHASTPVTVLTFTGIGLLTIIPFTALGRMLGFVALPFAYFAFLFATVLAYICLITIVKNLYTKHFGELL